MRASRASVVFPTLSSDAAAVVIGSRGYLLGGEDPQPLDTVDLSRIPVKDLYVCVASDEGAST